LVEVAKIPTRGQVNATPVVGDGVLFIGDGGGNGRFFYVIDLEHQTDGVNDYPRLVELDTGATVSTPLIGSGMQSTALYVTVDVALPGGGYAPERRVYFGANVKPRSFWCLDVDAILAKRAELSAQTSDGQEFLCEGADWPILIAGIGNVETNELDAPLPVYNGAPTFLKRATAANPSDRDVVITPTIGADCSDGQLWAIDAVDATVKWVYDPVPNFQNPGTPLPAGVGSGGMIWTVPALSADGRHLYVTTGDCVEQPQLGFQAESLVAIEPTTGEVAWYQQRRLVDAADFDIGNSPVVVDAPGPDGCNVVVTSDKDGCIYGHSQVRDVPGLERAVGDPVEEAIEDATEARARIGQQRTLWRTCFVPGSLGGGFNASAVTVSGRTVYA
ncbi:MAG: hypothetical protein ACREQY_18655, partial [Candidatus Binatia bacterium]